MKIEERIEKYLKEEYKFTGYEKNLFDRTGEPKYRVGDKVHISGSRLSSKTYIIEKVSTCVEWWKIKYNADDQNECNDKGKKFIYDMDNGYGYYEKDIHLANVNEEYKFTGREKDLFDRPKYKVGDKVLADGKTYTIKKIWSCEDFYKENYPNDIIMNKICNNKDDKFNWVYRIENNYGNIRNVFRHGIDKLVNESEYKFTGKEKHLFDAQPKFEEGEKVRLPKNKDLFIDNNVAYTKDYGYVYDINPHGKDIENRYRLTTNPPSPDYGYVICFKKDNKFGSSWENVLFYEKELEKY